MEAISVDELRKKKQELEDGINLLIAQFEVSTKVWVKEVVSYDDRLFIQRQPLKCFVKLDL